MKNTRYVVTYLTSNYGEASFNFTSNNIVNATRSALAKIALDNDDKKADYLKGFCIVEDDVQLEFGA